MEFQPSLETGMKYGVFWITKRIVLGQFASPKRAQVLRVQGVTHVLNVGDGESVVSADGFGFREIEDIAVADLEVIPTQIAIKAIDTLHRMLTGRDSRVFVHCVAGQNRSPTILWLYFIACGLDAEAARSLIVTRAPDAVPGHGRLIDDSLKGAAVEHGQRNYRPLLDKTILTPAY